MAKLKKDKAVGIYAKLLLVKEAVDYIKKDKKAVYSYASPSAVLGQLNPILNSHGLLLKPEVLSTSTQRVSYQTRNGEKVETLYTLQMRMTWIDVASGETDVSLWAASGCNGEEKGFGSALTYGERYFLLKYFNIPTDDDDPDAHQTKYNPAPAKEKAKVDMNAVKLAAYVEIGAAKTVADLEAAFKKRKAALKTDKKYVAAVVARKEELMDLEMADMERAAQTEAEARDKELQEKP